MPILSLHFDHAGRPTLELYVGVSAAEAEFRPPYPPSPRTCPGRHGGQ